jgi:hypothetical protein
MLPETARAWRPGPDTASTRIARQEASESCLMAEVRSSVSLKRASGAHSSSTRSEMPTVRATSPARRTSAAGMTSVMVPAEGRDGSRIDAAPPLVRSARRPRRHRGDALVCSPPGPCDDAGRPASTPNTATCPLPGEAGWPASPSAALAGRNARSTG